MVKKFDFAEVSVDCQAESHRILSTYIRYMLKKYRFGEYKHYIFQGCPRYSNYFLHINGLILKVRQNLFYEKKKLYYPRTNCRKLDILVARFILRKYKLNLIYDNKVKLKNNLYYKNYRFSLYYLLRDIVFGFSEKIIKFKNKKSLENNVDIQKNILIIAHDLTQGSTPYNHLPKQLSEFFNKSNKKVEYILPNNIGLTVIDKTRNLLFILYQLFFKLRLSINFQFSDIHFVLYQIYRKLYKNKLKRYFLRNNIEKIISSYINYEYEPVYY